MAITRLDTCMYVPGWEVELLWSGSGFYLDANFHKVCYGLSRMTLLSVPVPWLIVNFTANSTGFKVSRLTANTFCFMFFQLTANFNTFCFRFPG